MRLRSSILLATLVTGGSTAAAATLPTGFAETRIVNGLASPTAMAFAPDGRLFVCEQGGRLRVIKNGALLATPFVTAHRRLVRRAGAAGRGLRSQLRRRTSSSTSTTPPPRPAVHNRLSRFTANGDVAVPAARSSCST